MNRQYRSHLLAELAAALAMMALLQTPAQAQDSHYWSDQWGTRANLLGGVVIGSVGDLSSTYYNPGFLSLGAQTSFILATKVYEYSSLQLPAVDPDQVELGTSRLNTSPDFIAGEFTFGFLGDERFAYSLLTRESANLELKGRLVQPAPNASGPTSTLSSGEILERQSATEVWGGITYSRALSERIGVGATLYGAYRTQRRRNVFDVAETDSTLSTVVVSGTRDGNYWNGRVLMKLGFAWETDKLTLGLNFTTPSLSLFGSGEYFEQTATNGTSDGIPPDNSSYQSAVYEEGLDAEYKTSWAMGVGCSYRFGSVRIHLSGEYYDDVDLHTVMQISPWYPQSGGELQSRTVYQDLDSVFNYGVGVEVPLSDSWHSYGSFITDHSAALPRSETQDNLSLTAWDVYQVSAGAEIKFSKGSATVGLSYAFANDQVTLGDDSSMADGPDVRQEVKVHYRRIKLLLGFSIHF